MAPNLMARERLSALRETISRLENENLPGLAPCVAKADVAGFRQKPEGVQSKRTYLPLGVPDLDHILEGGLPLEGLTEIRAEQTRDAGAAAGFVLSLAALCQAVSCQSGLHRNPESQNHRTAPVLWIGQPMAMSEAGLPYAVGLQAYGLDIGRFLFATPRTLEDALWIAETALGVAAFTAVVLEIRGNPTGFGLSESRRLHLRARAGRLPLLLLRQAGEEEASSALFRLHVKPFPARSRLLPDGSMLSGSIGNPGFHVTAEKSRILSSTGIFMEWSAHDRRFSQFVPDTTAVRADATDPVAHLPLSASRQDGAVAVGERVAFQRAS